MSELAFHSATELVSMLRRRELSSRELLDVLLARVAKHGKALNAVVALDEERARSDAAAADEELASGRARGPLHGLPITIKDTFETAGLRTTAGAPELANHVPTRDADAVARLRRAGAIVFGKTNVPFMAGDWQSYNEIYGTTNNPWNAARVPGGSSGGAAAAVATGETPLELGSDIGGSIRVPAHWSGVCGHKPSWGIVPQRGHIPPLPGMIAAPDLNVCGPIARSVEDLSLALDVLAGPGELDAVGWRLELPAPRQIRLGEYRVAACFHDDAYPVDASVRAPLEAAVERLRRAGANVRVLEKPPFDIVAARRAYDILLLPLMAGSFPASALREFKAIADAAAPDDPSPFVATARAFTASHTDWIVANEHRERLRAQLHDAFREFDVLLLPVNQLPAIAHCHEPAMPLRTLEVNGKSIPYTDLLGWIAPATMCKLPASVVPVGRTPENLPVGIQIVGSHLEDRTTLDFARRLAEQSGGFTPPPGF
ncbi:MAG TPA: amidase [Myxococcota bacterium]|nr:amidase [Myxococcota bacterium]